MLRKSLLYLSERQGSKDLLLKLPAARRTAERFVAGETLEEALEAVRALNGAGFRATLDYLGESVTDREHAARAREAYLTSLEAIDGGEARSTISLKLTQLGLELDEELCVANLCRIVRKAADLNNFVRIDMEGSSHTEATLRIFRRVFGEHRNVGVVIQAYLRRSEADVAELVRLGAPVRLCKGAYDEPATAAFPKKSEVDANFLRLARMLLDGAVPTAIATHDEAIIEGTRAYVAERGIGRGAFEFQMLYGVRRDYQARLVEKGYGMRIYVPYGGEWYPYFMRRMAERPANLLFVLRALVGN